METMKTLFKCCLTFVVMLIGAFAAMFAFDSSSWLTNLSILAPVILFVAAILYLIWKKNWPLKTMTESKEKSIRNIGTYFLVIGVMSALYGIAFDTGIIIPICIILMCIPRSICDKKWAGVSLMISSILMTFALFYFIDIPFLLSEEYTVDVQLDDIIIDGILIVIALLNCYLCYRLFKLLFKTQ